MIAAQPALGDTDRSSLTASGEPMPLFFAPRRPLLRAAMIGGAAYMAGRAGVRAQESQYAEQAAEADQDQRIQELESRARRRPRRPSPGAPIWWRS
jgi:hypothetical protein